MGRRLATGQGRLHKLKRDVTMISSSKKLAVLDSYANNQQGIIN